MAANTQIEVFDGLDPGLMPDRVDLPVIPSSTAAQAAADVAKAQADEVEKFVHIKATVPIDFIKATKAAQAKAAQKAVPGMSMNQKLLIGGGALAILGTLLVLARR